MPKPVAMIADTYTFCPKCAARVDIGRVPVGSTLTCRVCTHEFNVNRSGSSTGAGQGTRRPQRGPTAKTRASDETETEVQRWPSADLFFSDTFTFPLRLHTFLHFVMLLLGTSVIVAGTELARWCAITDSETLGKSVRVLLWHGLLFSLSFGVIVALLWSWAASTWGLTILRDTSYGGETIESWPRLLALEGLGEWAFVVCSLMLAMLPGLMATPLWHWLSISRTFGVAVTVPVLFPVFLLSTLETNSPTDPFSPGIWRSLVARWPAWGCFYLISLAVAAVLGGLALLTHRLIDRGLGAAVLSLSVPFGWMVYCRLLGRLAGFCGGRIPGRDGVAVGGQSATAREPRL